MRKGAELSLQTVIVVIIAVFTLAVILVYLLVSEGGPRSLIDKVLDFLSGSVDYAQSTTGNI